MKLRKKNEGKIDKIIKDLSSINVHNEKFKVFLEDFYEDFCKSLNDDEKNISIEESLKDEILTDIKAFIKRKINYFKNRKESLSQGFFVTPMPYFWDDTVAAKEFYESFWEDVKMRRNGGLAKSIFNYFENSDKYEAYDWNSLKIKQNIEWE